MCRSRLSFAAVLLASVAAFHTARAEAPPVKIGALLHVTGEFARQGEAFREGLELAEHEINASGGIAGRPLKILIEDTQYKPLNSNSAAKKLAAVDGVTAVLISTVTEAKSAGPVLQPRGVPSIVLWDSSPEVEKLGNYFFGIGPWAPKSGESSAQFAVEDLHAKTALVINSNTEWSQYVSTYFVREFERRGGKVSATYSLNPDEVDFRAVIAKARSHRPDVIYAPIDGNIPWFFKQKRESAGSIPVITSDIVTDDLFAAAAGAFEGVYQTMTGDPDFPESKKMFESYRNFFGRSISQAAMVAWAYDAVRLVAHAIERAGNDRTKIREALLRVRDFHGASGVVSFNEHGSAPRPVSVFQVRGNGFVLVRRLNELS